MIGNDSEILHNYKKPKTYLSLSPLVTELGFFRIIHRASVRVVT
jgi:hypothetical protein